MRVGMLLIALVAISLGASAPLYSVDLLSGPEPKEVLCVEVGELVRLSVEAEQAAWSIVPGTKDGQEYGEGNCKYVCSFRTPGLYVVVAAVYRDAQVEIRKFPIQVGSTILPDPTVPVTPETAVNAELVSTTVHWCESTEADKPQCLLLADVLSKVATEIENGNLTGSDAIIVRTAELNSELELDGILKLMNKIQEYIRAESDASRLVDTFDYTVVWKSFAAGLREYAR